MLKRVRFFVSLVIFGLVAFCDWVKSAVKIKMGTIIDNNGEDKRDLDDSGCVQDGSPEQRMAEGGAGSVTLLDLSDDVLLYILRHCAPRDLKALGFSCPRLGRLVRERSLWRTVDARSECCGAARLAWYVAHALHADTRQLYVRGYADESSGCLGILNCSRQEAEEEQKAHQAQKSEAQANGTAPRAGNLHRHHACLYVTAHSAPGLPRFRGSPLWADEEGTCRATPGPPGRCCGPRFTVREPLLRELRARCPHLTRLALEHCNINCNTMNLGHLPPTLTALSLRGARCYNLPMDKSFLFKIQDHLPLLETLDVSECEWLEPASLLPLSKHGRLRELLMRDCHKLAEFVAYASLSSRYGFRSLQVLDLRGSPVGDSEVAPLAWLPRLQELRLSAVTRAAPPRHGHYADDAVAPRQDLDVWETQVPDYFKEGQDADDAGGDRMDADGGGGGADDDDDDDDDMNGGGSSGTRKTSHPEQGECSKSSERKRDGATTKRKAENGSGDAGVNGGRARSKRKKNKSDSSSSDDDSSKDSEEEMYEKRRCQTIVIVDRRYIGENEDATFVNFARRCVNEVNNRARNEERREGNEQDEDRREARNENAQENRQEEPQASKSDTDEAQDGKTNDRSQCENKIKPENEKVNDESDIIKPDNKIQDQVDGFDKDKITNDKSEANDKDDETGNVKSNDVPGCSKAKKPKLDNDVANSEVNRGASTSRQNPDNNSGNNNDSTNNEKVNNDRANGNGNEEGERYVRFRHGEVPVIVNVSGRPEGRQEFPTPEPLLGFNSYNIRREVIDNQQIFNVEIERCSMHGARPRQGQAEQHVGDQRPAEQNQNPPGPEPQAPQAQPGQAAPQQPQMRIEFHQALESLQRQVAERARLRERNPNIMNFIRGGDPVDMPPPLAVFPPFPGDLDEVREPRHRVLYVNVGHPANALGPLPNVIQGLVSDRENRILNLSRSHLNPSSLVTDAAVRRFGRAAGNDIRFVLVGIPHPVIGPNNDGSARPERSNLRVLVMNGYQTITDRSLIHLATAAPHLRLLDFRETNVTAQGVENFRSLRPDCEVLFSPYVERKVEWPDEDD